jgi:hypothetical protein
VFVQGRQFKTEGPEGTETWRLVLCLVG